MKSKLSFKEETEKLGRGMEKSMLVSAIWELDRPGAEWEKLIQTLLRIVNDPTRHYEVAEDFDSVIKDLENAKNLFTDFNHNSFNSLFDYAVGWALASQEKLQRPAVTL